MKKYLIIVVFVFCSFAASDSPVADCKCKSRQSKDTPLYGRVKIVEHHADFNIKIVEHHPDLRVKKVKHHADRCGLWQFVDDHPDFTVRFVEHHPDFTVQYVTHHPGLP